MRHTARCFEGGRRSCRGRLRTRVLRKGAAIAQLISPGAPLGGGRRSRQEITGVKEPGRALPEVVRDLRPQCYTTSCGSKKAINILTHGRERCRHGLCSSPPW